MIKIFIIMLISLIINNIIPGRTNKNREIMIILSILTMFLFLGEILLYNNNNNEYQNRFDIFGYSFGLDGISLSLIGLIVILDPILILISSNYRKLERNNILGKENKRIINYITIIKFLTIILFSSLDLFIFFITFELILIPMFLLITRYGSSYQYFIPRLEAGIRFFMYTMIGSILMFLGIILLFCKFGTTSNELLNFYIAECSNIYLFKFIWFFFFFSFLIKIPIFPFHTWLPLAHSDAPTIGSIILAAILLKLASFGILRYSLYLFESHSLDKIYLSFLPFIFILALLSIIYCSFIPLRGIYDLKKIIAYSSIIHMNFSIFGFFSKDFIGLLGASFLMFTHALISSALFLLIGFLYNRYHTRFLIYYQGLFSSMPSFSFFFLFFSFANISLPFCSSFLSEFFILISSFHINPFLSSFLLSSLFLSSSFVLWFTNRLLFGSLSSYLIHNPIIGFKDLSLIEIISLLPFLFFTFFLTFFPQPLISLLSLSLNLYY